ncbi:DUF11 domain-containing protein [Amycolatopsis sp. SID8362]|uniref:DUF11 domain-containing protein n=1 Tax=Amycolatopsis sp. SID8362 TaxID=2690346 RepID=UPI00136E31A3|nr:DUF11 domain-containing protein [Amycolatopsis sp. SID8362]NBH03510.1 hypothetical protein [Amycolatopsis sp. SID8362]NED40210.1 hypothetical protein [Amycolatopsis sp. SID8362]
MGVLSSATAVLLALLTPGIAHAETLDQRQEDTSRGTVVVNQTATNAQTFTSAISGTLNRVDLYLQNNSSTHDVIMELHNVTTDGAPADLLSTYTVPIGNIPAFPGGWVPITVNQPVTAMAQYAIVLRGQDAGYVQWDGADNNPYLGGNNWYRSPTWTKDFFLDLGFKTYATGVGAQTDVSVSLSATTNGILFPTVTFTATMSNTGPDLAARTVLYLRLPDDGSVTQVKLSNPESCTSTSGYILCDVGDIASLQNKSVSFQAKITSPGTHTVNATIYSPNIEANPVNNKSSATCSADTTTAFVTC